MKKTIGYRVLALSLVVVLSVGAFAGCKKGTTSSDIDSDMSVSYDDYFVYDPDNSADASTTSGGTVSGYKGGNKGNTSGGNTSGNGNTTKEDRLAVFKNMPAKLRGTTVSFAQWGDEGGDRYRKLAQKFTSDYGIKVKWVDYSQTNYSSEILTQIAANNGPDIIICTSDFPSTVEVTQPLPSYFNLNDGFWDKRVSEALRVKGKYYYVNTYNSTFIETYFVIYNKKIFSSKGITTPDEYYSAGKWTYENFIKCMEAVTKAGYTGALLNNPLTLANHLGGRDIFTYNPDTATFSADITNNAVLEAMQIISESFQKNIAVDYANFTNGRVGLMISTPWALKYNGNLKDMAPSDVGVVPLPTSYKGKKLDNFLAGARGYGIAKGAKNPEGAYYFLRYYLDYENYQAAGINIFSNKTLEKYFVEKILPEYKKGTKMCSSYAFGLTRIAGVPFYPYNDPWKAAFQAAPSQVATELAKLQGICDNAAKLGSERLKSIK